MNRLLLFLLTYFLVFRNQYWRAYSLLFLAFLIAPDNIIAEDEFGCTMVCIGHVNLSLDSDCESTVTYRTLLADPDNIAICQPNGYQAFKVSIFDGAGNDIGNKVNASHIGRTLEVRIKHWYTGNYCWGTITVEDKVGPWANCPDDVWIGCTDSTDPSKTGSPNFMDCSAFTVDYYDEITYKDCPSTVSMVIKRTWVATDEFGNAKSCSQNIFVERSSLSDVKGPVNYDGTGAPDQPALSCGASILPEDLGGSGAFPTIGGKPIDSGNNACKINVSYEDGYPIPTCGNGYKIIREWLVLDWCDGTDKRYIQIIKVGDEVAPSISCNYDIIAGTNSHECKATVHIPPATVSDNCSNVTVRINTPYGQILSNGGTLQNVPIGTYEITYIATDECGNQATCKSKLIVEDDDTPIAICDQSTVVALSSESVTQVDAKVFDSGSYDNCDNVDFLATRTTEFGKYVPFTCDDVDAGVIMVRLRVFEVNNPSSYSECMIEVIVQDKNPPVLLTCPANITVDCDDLDDDLGVYGAPTFEDNCGFEVVPTVKRDLDNCGVGTITRTWVASDENGSVFCQQRITVLNQTPFDGSNITFPPDVTIEECGAQITEEIIGEPTIPNYVECGLLSVNYVDEKFTGGSDACFKIIRKWKIIDWCQYNPGYDPNKGKWEHYQTIKVIDNVRPELSVPDDIVFYSTENNCQSADVEVPLATAQDCNPDVSIYNNSPYSNSSGNNASGRYPYGTTEVTYTANDGCGNLVSKKIHITVKDGTKPSPVCLSGLVVEMGQSGSVEIWASDLEASSSDNCTDHANLKFRVRINEGSLDNLTPPSTTNLTIGCDVFDNIDTPNGSAVPIEFWVGDEAGNWDFCLTFIAVQDNMGACPDPTDAHGGDVSAMISGKIENSKGVQVKDVDLNLNSNNPLYDQFVAGINGNYVFANLESGMNYDVTPSKTGDFDNGISTFDILKITRHILGSEPFSSPYQILAADVTGNGSVSTSDILALRRVILSIESDFNGEQPSWIFVPTDYQFDDPTDPLSENYASSLSFNGLSDEVYDANFIGIKMGDINDSASTDLLGKQEHKSKANLTTMDQTFESGDIIELPLIAEELGMLDGLQFFLEVDPQSLEIIGINDESHQVIDASNYVIEDNGLRFSWVQAASSHVDQLLNISLRAKKSGSLAKAIYIKENNTFKPEFYHEGSKIGGLGLSFLKSQVLDSQMEIYPNPFSEMTTIAFDLPSSQAVSIRLFDLAGREIYQVEKSFDQGQNALELSKDNFNGPGVYYVQIRYADTSQTKKLVLAY